MYQLNLAWIKLVSKTSITHTTHKSKKKQRPYHGDATLAKNITLSSEGETVRGGRHERGEGLCSFLVLR
jgi:hypothetical protein